MRRRCEASCSSVFHQVIAGKRSGRSRWTLTSASAASSDCWFDKFQEFGSARQVVLWAQDQALQLPVIRRNNSSTCKIEWRPTPYHTALTILGHPVYAGAYVFGRTTQRTRIVDGRARKTTGHTKPITGWNVLLRDHHPGYISWERCEETEKLISE